MRAGYAVLLTALLSASAGSLRAQAGPRLERGTMVRVVIPADGGRPERVIAGSLYRVSGDTVVLAAGLRVDTLALTSGRRLEVRTASIGHTRQGALVGFLVGGATGAIVAAAAYEPCRPQQGWFSFCYDLGEGGTAAGGFLLGGLAGSVLGAVVGSAIRHEEWTPVTTTGVRVAPAVSPRGAGISMRLTF